MKTIPKSVRHTFSPDEKQELTERLLNSLDTYAATETEFDAVKSTFKARLAEAESSVNSIRSLLRAGFEMRVQDCVIIYRVKDGYKDYYLSDDWEWWMHGRKPGEPGDKPKPVLTEKMTDDDYQQELLEAESVFDDKEAIELFKPTESDRGVLMIGKFKGLWFTALRIKVGKSELNERLNTEQQACKAREDALRRARSRCLSWLKENTGDAWKGFEAAVRSALIEETT